MKIKISETESYEVFVANEYTAQNFLAFLKRLQTISEILISESEPKTEVVSELKPKRAYVRRGRPITKSCINCSSNNLYRDGYSYSDGKKYQKYGCKDCGKRFSELHTEKGITPKEYTKRRPAVVKWDKREDAIKVMKTHYFGTKQEKESLANQKGAPSWNYIVKSIHNLKKRYNIRPQEIGLSEFPTRKNRVKKKVEETPKFFKAPTPNPPLELHRKIEKEEKENEEKKQKEFDIDEFLKEQL
jgi:hypothetical protein